MGMLVGGLTFRPKGDSETVNLSGTSGTPYNPGSDISSSPTDASAYVEFRHTGELWIMKNVLPDSQIKTGVEWNEGQDGIGGNYWIRADYNAGDATNGDSDSTGTWLRLVNGGTSQVFNRKWGFLRDYSVDGLGFWEGSFRVRISSDSAGGTILADGYYQTRAEVES